MTDQIHEEGNQPIKKNDQQEPREGAHPLVDEQETVIEPETPPALRADEDRFSLPRDFDDRFVVTRGQDHHHLYRSYDDHQPVMTDKGDKLSTKRADRATAMDMIDLAAHRGWETMTVRGPKDFRREIWIEATTRSIEVKGYRPDEKDQAEAARRAELIGERSIERGDTQHPGETHGPDKTGTRQARNVLELPDYHKGVQGKIMDFGEAPYRGREGAADTPWVDIERQNGHTHRIWGVGIPDMLDKHGLDRGDQATIHSPGQKPVTVQEKDPKTGKMVERHTYRREWEARDIERGRQHDTVDRSDNPAKIPVASMDETAEIIKKSERERIEERLRDPATAVKEPQLKGALSKLALVEAALRAADVPEKERQKAADILRREMARNIAAGKIYPVEKLPNVTKEQLQAARDKAHKQIQAEKAKTPQQSHDVTRNRNIDREQTKDKDPDRTR